MGPSLTKACRYGSATTFNATLHAFKTDAIECHRDASTAALQGRELLSLQCFATASSKVTSSSMVDALRWPAAKPVPLRRLQRSPLAETECTCCLQAAAMKLQDLLERELGWDLTAGDLQGKSDDEDAPVVVDL